MTFRFRMATMLQLRERDRDERRRELAQALEAERRLMLRTEEIHLEIETLRNEKRNRAAGGEISVERLLNDGRYELILRAEIANLAKQIEQVRAEAERRRQALTEADREVKVLEKLRERRREQYREQEDRLDTKRLDELASAAFARRASEEIA